MKRQKIRCLMRYRKIEPIEKQIVIKQRKLKRDYLFLISPLSALAEGGNGSGGGQQNPLSLVSSNQQLLKNY